MGTGYPDYSTMDSLASVFLLFFLSQWMGDFGGDWRFIAFPMLTSWGIFKYNGQIVLPHGTNFIYVSFSSSLLFTCVSVCYIT